jgi:hypothetical protein
MFDLEQSIVDWRRQMLAAGIKTPMPLEELEIHLREEIEQQIKSGLNPQRTFENAVQKIGQANLLKNEFQKARPLTLDRIISIAVGIPTVFVGLWIVWIAVVQSRAMEKIPDEKVRLIGMFGLAFILGTVLVVMGLILVFYGGNNVSWLPNARYKRKYV